MVGSGTGFGLARARRVLVSASRRDLVCLTRFRIFSYSISSSVLPLGLFADHLLEGMVLT